VSRRLVFSPEAENDLRELYLYIAARSGPRRALDYVERIEVQCASLREFPERGTQRDDLWPGLRVIAFERRVSIALLVAGDTVTILRILYGGRELDSAFPKNDATREET